MWTVVFLKDTETEDIGTVTATWTAEGESLTVTFERVNQKLAIADFVAKAMERLASYRAAKAKVDAISTKLAQALNEAAAQQGLVDAAKVDAP